MMSPDRKTALVLGVTGGAGSAIAEALQARGWHIRALVRRKADSDRGRPGPASRYEYVEGDATVRADVARAAAGVGAIVHAVNPPGYRNWEKLVLPMIDNTIAAAQSAGGARIVLPGTVYNFDPAASPLVTADSPQQPHTRKGRIRVEMEARLAAASASAPALIVRAGDFFGPHVRNSWFAQALVKPGKRVRRIVNPGKGVGHSWVYLPDLGAAVAQLLDREDRLKAFERVQLEGVWDASGTAMVEAIRRAAGDHRIPETGFPWWLMRALAPFGGLPRELVEIEPYWRHPMHFDNRRLVELIGQEPRTPLDEAVATALTSLGCMPAATPSRPAGMVSEVVP